MHRQVLIGCGRYAEPRAGTLHAIGILLTASKVAGSLSRTTEIRHEIPYVDAFLVNGSANQGCTVSKRRQLKESCVHRRIPTRYVRERTEGSDEIRVQVKYAKSSSNNAIGGSSLSLLDLQLVVFRLGSQRYALPLAAVDRIIRAVEVTPLPGAPHIVLGVIDVEGSILPVLSIRRRLQLSQREIAPADQFLIAWAAGRAVALVIDEVQGVMEREQSAVTPSHGITAGLEQFEGIVRLDDGLALIHDPQKFLSLDEARALDEAIDRAE